MKQEASCVSMLKEVTARSRIQKGTVHLSGDEHQLRPDKIISTDSPFAPYLNVSCMARFLELGMLHAHLSKTYRAVPIIEKRYLKSDTMTRANLIVRLTIATFPRPAKLYTGQFMAMRPLSC